MVSLRRWISTIFGPSNPTEDNPISANRDDSLDAPADGGGVEEAGALPQQERLVAEPWYVDSIEFSAERDRVTISGWAFPDPDFAGADPASRFLVNGAPPRSARAGLSRPDVQKVFWQRQNAEPSGFVIEADAAFPGGVMEITCQRLDTRLRDLARDSWFFTDPVAETRVPDDDRRFRVIGNRDLQGFLLIGATDAHRLRYAFERLTGRSLQDASAVLDWGVGCGRIARHLSSQLGDRLYGCDIDRDNVEWCSANLPGQYKLSKLTPPLPYDDDTFDLIYGISVFTHLRSEWESAWLSELRRVLKPGGLMLVTVHGRTAIDFAGLSPEEYETVTSRVEQAGLLVASENTQLVGFVENPEEYVNVYHSEAYIHNTWGKYFENVRIMNGYIFTHDLVAVW